MNAKERVLRTLNFQETDRVPFGTFGTNEPEEQRMMRDLGYASVEDLYRGLGVDIWHLFQPLTYTGPQRFHEGVPADFWGVPLDIRSHGNSSSHCPLAEVSSVDEVEAYPFPDIRDFDTTRLEKLLEEHEDFAIEGGLWAPIFHNVTWLCGFETTLMNFIAEPEISKALLRRVTDFWIDYAKLTLETAKGRILIMQNCNDFGTQRDLIMSRELFCTYFKPELKRLYDVIKSYDVYVMQHSCGAVSGVIGDFIEMGADIINPLQVSAHGMDVETIVRKFGGKAVFYGGIDTQHVLPEGPEDVIRREVDHTLDAFKECGGYILGPSQGLEADISTAHAQILYDEGRRYYHTVV